MNTGKASSSRGPRRKSCSENLDRFILNRSAMDWDYAHYMLTEGKKGKGTPVRSSPANEAYRKALADSLNMIGTRILAFKDKPPTLKDGISTDWSFVQQPSPDVGSPEVAAAKVSAKEAASVPFADLKYIR